MNQKLLIKRIRHGVLLLVLAMNPTLPAFADTGLSEREESVEFEQNRQAAEAALSQPQDWKAVARDRATGSGSEGLHGINWDIRNLSPAQLEFKYGEFGVEIMDRIAGGSRQNIADAVAQGNAERKMWGYVQLLMGFGLLVAFAIVVRRFWLVVTNRDVAYKLGSKARRLSRNAGYVVGRATGKIENAAEVVGRSFQDGRDSTKRSDSDPDGEA